MGSVSPLLLRKDVDASVYVSLRRSITRLAGAPIVVSTAWIAWWGMLPNAFLRSSQAMLDVFVWFRLVSLITDDRKKVC